MFAIISKAIKPTQKPMITIGGILGPPPLTSKNLMIPAEDIGPLMGSELIPFICLY